MLDPDLCQVIGPSSSHHIGASSPEDSLPPVADALAAVHTIDFVGVLELVHEALCLLEFKLTGRLDTVLCTCASADGGSGSGATVGGQRRTHTLNPGQKQRRSMRVADVPSPTMQGIDSITSVDQRVYRSAVLRLLCDLRALEAATGERVLCEGSLARLRNTTAHIAGLWGE